MHSAPTWQDQWARVQRYFDRVFRLAEGVPAPTDSQAELDDTYSFFLHCYHLKDWLINDPSSGKSRQDVEDFITNTPALALCADVANSVKHLKRDREPRSGSAPSPLHARFRTELAETFAFEGEERPFTSAVVYVEHEGARKAVVRVAQQAVEAWRKFLS